MEKNFKNKYRKKQQIAIGLITGMKKYLYVKKLHLNVEKTKTIRSGVGVRKKK